MTLKLVLKGGGGPPLRDYSAAVGCVRFCPPHCDGYPTRTAQLRGPALAGEGVRGASTSGANSWKKNRYISTLFWIGR